MRQSGRDGKKKADKKEAEARRQERAYGCGAPICMNAGCVMRKKAGCFGFEGCPGFKGR